MPKDTELVTIYIDETAYQVPKGSNLVDVSKFYADNDIPVFCYHPKMDPVGMCRMCLVEMGMQERDRESGQLVFEETGEPKVRWFPKLQTACTQQVSDGLVIRTGTNAVVEARDNVIEFLLTSHPLDCPICDKGGECPLQNLTMRHGEGHSRFNFDDKQHLAKHVPLGDLIYLDRERCIQCARCTRFCDEVVGDPVLGFHERGRSLQIVTLSDPPFDTYFSGNTTDICPVGALTTADFRFGARPWELDEVPSLDPYGPEGTNISLSTRLDRDAGGIKVIKRVMPRQNEYVNEIWVSDKTRFGHHHSRSGNRVTDPMIRKGGKLVPVQWEEALAVVADAIKGADGNVGAVAGPMLSNEDLWELRGLVVAAGSLHLGVYPATMTGAAVVEEVGVARGTNFSDMGEDTTILVVASDLEEEAPIWWLRTKGAGDRGATIVTLNARPTKLDSYAGHVLSYDYGDAVGAINHLIAKITGVKSFKKAPVEKRAKGLDAMLNAVEEGERRTGYTEAARLLARTENLVIIAGNEGCDLKGHGTLMQALANLLIVTDHVGRPNNGLIPVWPGANTQGAFDLGFSAEATADALEGSVVIAAGADLAGTDLEAAAALERAGFVVAVSLFETATTQAADVVLPRQSVPERDGTFTSGERRVQRFYTAQGGIGNSLPDWRIFAELHRVIDENYIVKPSAGSVMMEIVKNIPNYAEMSYKNLARVERQFPDVGGNDLYYGGTAYGNRGGLGVQWAVKAEDAEAKLTLKAAKASSASRKRGLTAVPVRVLYDRSPEFLASEMMHGHIPQPFAELNSADASKLGVSDGDKVALVIEEQRVEVVARVNGKAPAGIVLVPKNVTGAPLPTAPAAVKVEK